MATAQVGGYWPGLKLRIAGGSENGAKTDVDPKTWHGAVSSTEWTDLSTRVRSVELLVGVSAPGPTARVAPAGAMTVTLDNADGYLRRGSTNTFGDGDGLMAGKHVELALIYSGSTYVLARHHVDDAQEDRVAGTRQSWVTLRTIDRLGFFGPQMIDPSPIPTSEALYPVSWSTRVHRTVVTKLGLGTSSLTNDTTGSGRWAMLPTTWGRTAAEHLDEVVRSMGGEAIVWCPSSGKIAVRHHNWPMMSDTIAQTISSTGSTQLRYSRLALAWGRNTVRNMASASVAGSTHTYWHRSTASAKLWGTMSTDLGDLSVTHLGAAAQVVEGAAVRWSTARAEAEQLVVEPMRNPTHAWPKLLSLTLGSRVRVRERHAGPAVTSTWHAHVFGMRWALDAERRAAEAALILQRGCDLSPTFAYFSTSASTGVLCY